MIVSSLCDRGVSNDTSRVPTILNNTIDDTTQSTPTEDFFESDDEEDNPFKSLSTFVFDGRIITFVSQIINDMVSMKNIV